MTMSWLYPAHQAFGVACALHFVGTISILNRSTLTSQTRADVICAINPLY